MTLLNHVFRDEPASLDHDRLGALYSHLGSTGAEDVVRRAMEELALRLGHAEALYNDRKLEEMRKGLRAIVAIADQIGMLKLTRVADQVSDALQSGDEVAIAATFARLLRVSESSLTAIWDLQDFTI